jgi:hypothetical protein
MGRLAHLAEAVLKAVGTPDMMQGQAYRLALRFIKEGILPNGQGYADGPPRLIVTLGDVESCELVRVSQAAEADGSTRFEARFEVHPSRAGGAGVSIDGAITEFFMSYAESAPCDDSARIELGAALRAVCDERMDKVRQAFEQLLIPDDFIWRLVGWPQRGAWDLERVHVERVTLGDTWVEETRGETWLAKHWEVWVPATLDVVAALRRK